MRLSYHFTELRYYISCISIYFFCIKINQIITK